MQGFIQKLINKYIIYTWKVIFESFDKISEIDNFDAYEESLLLSF